MNHILRTPLLLLLAATLAHPAFTQQNAPAAPQKQPTEERARRQADARAKRQVDQAVALAAEGEEPRAISLLEAVPKRFPESTQRFRAWLELGRIHLSKGRTDEALAELRKVQSAPDRDTDAEALLLQAQAHASAGRESEAAMLLRRITTDYPESPVANDAWFQIGQIHFRAKRWVRAQEAFRRVGTAVPKPLQSDQPAPVLAEAGQRLYAVVDDRDIAVAVALGQKLSVRIQAASGDSETVELKPYGQDKVSALASIPTTAAPSKPNDGVLTIQGGEKVSVVYTDAMDASGRANVVREAPVRFVSSAVLSIMDGAWRQSVKGVFLGNPAFIRLRDLDLDVSDKPDEATVEVVSWRKQPKPSPEQIADALAKGESVDENPDPFAELVRRKVVLRETAPHSGVFEGRVVPQAQEGQDAIRAEADGKLSFEYRDALHLGGEAPRTVTAEVAVLVGGSTEPQSIVSAAADPVLQSRKLLLEARLLHQWASIFKEVGLDAQASAKADEALVKVDEMETIAKRHAVPRDLVERRYAVEWDLYLVKGNLPKAIEICHKLLREYPDTLLADLAFLKIAKVRGESKNPREVEEAARIYRSILAMPNAANKAEAQFRLAGILEKMARFREDPSRKPDYTAAIAAYRLCAENYPQSAFAGEAFKRIVAWQIEKKDLERAEETLQRVFQDYPDAPWLDEMLLRWGIVCYRRGDIAAAREKFRRVLEEYPSGSAASQASSFLERLDK